MKYKLPIVTGILLLCFAVFWQHILWQNGFAQPNQSNRIAVDDNRSEQGRGQTLVRQAVHQMLQLRSVTADVRQRIRLFDQELFGVGSYKQMIVADSSLVRLELNVPLTSEATQRLLQISDGRSLWTRRSGPSKSTLEVVNLTRVQQVIEYQQSTAARFGASWMMLGGLPKLLQSLADHFEFGSPVGKRIQNVPVWEVTGTWKRSSLAELRGKDLNQPLPHQVPEMVRLVLGKGQPLPLFPYRCEFGRRQTGQGGPAGQGGARYAFKPMVTLEFYRVRKDASIDPQLFKFRPGDESVIDQTDAVLESLKPILREEGVEKRRRS